MHRFNVKYVKIILVLLFQRNILFSNRIIQLSLNSLGYNN